MSNLTRYKWALHSVRGGFGVGTVVIDPEGEYVKFDDIKDLLQTSTNKQSTPLPKIGDPDAPRFMDLSNSSVFPRGFLG